MTFPQAEYECMYKISSQNFKSWSMPGERWVTEESEKSKIGWHAIFLCRSFSKFVVAWPEVLDESGLAYWPPAANLSQDELQRWEGKSRSGHLHQNYPYPFSLKRSRTSHRCGDVKRPVLYPDDLSMLSTIAQVEPWSYQTNQILLWSKSIWKITCTCYSHTSLYTTKGKEKHKYEWSTF